MSELCMDIERRGYSNVPIGLTNTDLEETIDLYQEFVNLPEKYHAAVTYEAGSRGNGNYGQFTRWPGDEDARGASQDRKDELHFGPATRQVAEKRLEGDLPKVMKWLLGYCEELFWAAQKTKLTALYELNDSSHELVDVLYSEQEQLNDLLRLVLYYSSDSSLAKGHFDRSATSLAIGESHEGLRMTPGYPMENMPPDYLYLLNKNLKPVNHKEGWAKFFIGSGWQQLPEHLHQVYEKFPAAWHDVVNSDKRVNDKVARWAIVLFNNPYLAYEHYKVPTPTQTRPYKGLKPAESS